jgi:hypothetical protein
MVAFLGVLRRVQECIGSWEVQDVAALSGSCTPHSVQFHASAALAGSLDLLSMRRAPFGATAVPAVDSQ